MNGNILKKNGSPASYGNDDMFDGKHISPQAVEPIMNRYGIRTFAGFIHPRSWLFFIALLAGTQQVAGLEHSVGRMTAKDVFEDASLRRIAEAACRGDAETVNLYASSGVNPNGSGLEGLTPLAWAVSCDSVEGVQALLKVGADPNQAIGDEFSSVVYIAAGRSDPGPLKALLEAGAEANVFDLKSERTGLTQALSRGIEADDWRHWELLLEKADINRPMDKFGGTIATYAASFNQFERVVQLLEKGYSYRLRQLGRYVEVSEGRGEPFATWQKKAIQILNNRGVVFPVGPIAPELLSEVELQRLPPRYQE